jgi:lysophospholipase L1-like esterase
LNKDFPQDQFDVVSIGLSSETVSGLSEKDHPFPRPHLAERIDRALELYKPQVVVACYGMNDGIYHPLSAERMQAFQAGVQNLMKKVKAAGAQLVLLTPPPFDSRLKQNTRPADAAQFGYKTPFDGYDSVLAAYVRWELSLPASDVRVIDLHTPMARYLEQHRQSKPEFALTTDGVHPNQPGHLLMAETILNALGAHGPDDAGLDAQLSGILADPLYPLVKTLRETRSKGWLPYVGYTSEQKTKANSISDTEKSATELQKEIDRMRHADAAQMAAAK